MPIVNCKMFKKSINDSLSEKNVITEENFQYIILEIINDVIEKKKQIHLKYDQLIKKVWFSQKNIDRKTIIAKYILTRVLRESDRAFNEAQKLAKQLCPSCKKKISNYENYSESLH